MSLADEYRRQLSWRSWEEILDLLPPMAGRTVLDLGCAVGDQAAALVARGASVIGMDADEELLAEARSRSLVGVDFRLADLRSFKPPAEPADGLWCSFTAAYFPDLAETLVSWKRCLRPGGWIALTEVDDLFGHGPLSRRSRSLLDGFAREALLGGTYDFRMGRKLASQCSRAGCMVSRELTVADREFSFQGVAGESVLRAWRRRFERLAGLREFCGSEFESVRDEFIGCLTRADHRSKSRVFVCFATA